MFLKVESGKLEKVKNQSMQNFCDTLMDFNNGKVALKLQI